MAQGIESRRPGPGGTLTLAMLVALAAAGCASLRPYAEVAAALPSGSLITVDGQRVHVVDRGVGDPLVLLHGFGASTLLWEPVLPRLAASRRASSASPSRHSPMAPASSSGSSASRGLAA